MYLGAWTLATRPFLLRALKMKTSGNFGGPIVSAISSEATLWYVTLSDSEMKNLPPED